MATLHKNRKIHDRLVAHRLSLLARYKDSVEEGRDTDLAGPHEVIDLANEQWDARVTSAMSEVDARALRLVVGALRRLESGSYGRCVECGESITHGRLDAMPEAPECLECASAAERDHVRHDSTLHA